MGPSGEIFKESPKQLPKEPQLFSLWFREEPELFHTRVNPELSSGLV
jgi:hypothetical protein